MNLDSEKLQDSSPCKIQFPEGFLRKNLKNYVEDHSKRKWNFLILTWLFRFSIKIFEIRNIWRFVLSNASWEELIKLTRKQENTSQKHRNLTYPNRNNSQFWEILKKTWNKCEHNEIIKQNKISIGKILLFLNKKLKIACLVDSRPLYQPADVPTGRCTNNRGN